MHLLYQLSDASPNFRLLPSANEIVEHISDNETVLVSSRKPGGAAEDLVVSSENRICWSSRL